jgi:hypothetical protein
MIIKDLEGDLKVQLRVSLFDLRYKKFYGRTWSGPIVKLNHKKGKIKLDNKERLLFHTPIRDHDIVIAVELLCLKNDMKPLSLGWAVFRPFNLIDTKTVSKKDANFRYLVIIYISYYLDRIKQILFELKFYSLQFIWLKIPSLVSWRKIEFCFYTLRSLINLQEHLFSTIYLQRVGFYHGTPRALLFLDDLFEGKPIVENQYQKTA